LVRRIVVAAGGLPDARQMSHDSLGGAGLVRPSAVPQISSMVRPVFDISQLTTAQRLELIERLWESLRVQPDVLPPTDAELAMLRERRAEHERDPDSAIPWETVRAELYADQEVDEAAAKSEGSGERGG
jgi:putative addiction module component (TIGR02574 family)